MRLFFQTYFEHSERKGWFVNDGFINAFFLCDAFRFYIGGHWSSANSSVRRWPAELHLLLVLFGGGPGWSSGMVDLTHSSGSENKRMRETPWDLCLFFLWGGETKGWFSASNGWFTFTSWRSEKFFLGRRILDGGLNHVESFILFCSGKPWFSWHQPHLRWFTQGPLVATFGPRFKPP